ncbi:uncharacterized protein N7506_005218 [Penicillium brevicompactum]|uniref:uncharacterized protein n=1 Tax=Penicillium brevicompactum TaxID=5074 RepID=UPI002540736B|nr:uncharacterized protein N7506_005218 [Penicillium brevicompactum]KAJ5337196.1 hypothetical protein N7506_005218 [Penicillium brevicompactum]
MRLTAAACLAFAAAISGVTAESIVIKICNGAYLEGTCITPSIGIQHDCYSLKDKANGVIQGDVRSVHIPDGYRCRFWTYVLPTPWATALADICCVIFSSYSCNGGSTGDIQAPGQDSTSPPSMGSVKCYAN